MKKVKVSKFLLRSMVREAINESRLISATNFARPISDKLDLAFTGRSSGKIPIFGAGSTRMLRNPATRDSQDLPVTLAGLVNNPNIPFVELPLDNSTVRPC